ncbi:hypothetical protein T492DRAFT_1068799, partial [Pavlovales sp. CCMP2436]|mmetsp:Transcript_17768/g.45470  ORF Transcript_17768/g.45470 Transcript_17768/m.45470 type:complete len:150 (+) Transcript_17768:25-474(+)
MKAFLLLALGLAQSAQGFAASSVGQSRGVPGRAVRQSRAATHALLPLGAEAQLTDLAHAAAATSVMLSEEMTGDVFRLVLSGAVGIIAFTLLNTFLVGVIARGNWQVFEDEAASWVKDEPGVQSLRSNMLTNDEIGLTGAGKETDDDEE